MSFLLAHLQSWSTLLLVIDALLWQPRPVQTSAGGAAAEQPVGIVGQAGADQESGVFGVAAQALNGGCIHPPVGAGLPAKAVGQLIHVSTDPPPSLASQLLQGCALTSYLEVSTE
ncbi:hypothetical protein [Pseudomonas sp. MPC6]|uniref:hypothetical protein n=1 Tax=unclassified Pseudomonas TaxID=196821 RepID=UPI0015B0CA8B|nr:hypothetical protein [Pseudomonas sp. MPC6]